MAISRTLVEGSQILLCGLEEFIDVSSGLILHVKFKCVTHSVARNHTR